MKKSILMVMALMVLAVPAVTAQKNVNVDATLSKLAKSDADIANEKKAAKAATWLNRAKVTIRFQRFYCLICIINFYNQSLFE